GKPAKYQLKVRHYEVDQYGHVNHAQYVHYLEVARIEALDALGLSLGEMRKLGYLILAADLAVKYHAPARSGDTLAIVTYVREVWSRVPRRPHDLEPGDPRGREPARAGHRGGDGRVRHRGRPAGANACIISRQARAALRARRNHPPGLGSFRSNDSGFTR